MEHSAGRDGALGLQDDCQGARVQEEEDQVPRRWGERQPEPNVSDAWDGVRRDEEDAAGLRRELADEGAEKLAAPALDARARDAWLLPLKARHCWLEQSASPDAAALCKPDEVRSAERSCAEPEAGALQERKDARRLEQAEQQPPAQVALELRAA